jgi:hypothetical protein
MMEGNRWYCYEDDQKGRPYYYNTETDECVFEKPVDYDGDGITPPEAIEQITRKVLQLSTLDLETKKALDKAKELQKLDEIERNASVNDGQEHWVECFDPWTQKFYYYGHYSGETTWEKPTNYVMAAGNRCFVHQLILIVTITFSFISDDDLIMAGIRIQCAYRSKVARSKTNMRLQQFQGSYENQKIELQKSEGRHINSAGIWMDANGEEDQPTEDRLIAQRPTKEDQDPTWYTCQDSEGNAYYYNAKTEECYYNPELDGISATCPSDLLSSVQKLFEGKAKRAQKAAEAKRDAGIAAGEEHWVECFDPATDRFYYYGNYSGQVMWEKPEHYVMAADDELMTAVVRIQSAFRARMARLSTKDLAALKNVVWYMMDDGEGNTYYYNSTNGECWLVFSPIAPPIINKSVIGECWFV